MKNIFDHLYRRAEFVLALSTMSFVFATTYRFWFNSDKLFYSLISPTIINGLVVGFLYCLLVVFLVLTEFYCKDKSHSRLTHFIFYCATCVIVTLLILFQNGLLPLLLIILVVRLNEYQFNKGFIYFVICIPLYFSVANDLLYNLSYAYFNGCANTILNLFGLTFSSKILAEQKAKEKSAHLVRELKATQRLLNFTSKRDERLRIARDLHDVLGHHLTALSIQLEVACHTEGDASKKHIHKGQDITKLLLSDIRQAVTDIRESCAIDIQSSLADLCEDIPKIKIDLNVKPGFSLNNARQAELIFRCVQEALTNVLKHSKGSHCEITLTKSNKHIFLSIQDDGAIKTELVEGNGLTGMRERLAILDGTLSVTMGEDGLNLKICIPNHEDYLT